MTPSDFTSKNASSKTKPGLPVQGRLFLVLLLALLPFGLGSCGGEKEAEKGQNVSQLAQERLDAAGQNFDELFQVREWLLKSASEFEENSYENGEMRRKAIEASKRIGDSFRTVASSLSSKNVADAKKLINWANDVITKEKARPEELRGALAADLENCMKSLNSIVLDAEPANDELRKKSGYREHTVNFADFLELEYLDEDKDINRINSIIELVADALETSPSGKKWLPPTFDMTEYLAVQEMVKERKTEFDARLKDPFQAAAHAEFLAITRYLKDVKKLDGYQWVGRTHEPYLFVVERDNAWNETDVAEKKFKQLEELQILFNTEYGERFGLKEIKKPLPLIIFKRASAYQQYAVGAVTAGALGHYEHGTGRIVLSDNVGRDTMFHEGTHQLVTQHTQYDTIANFLTRSYWFSEGVAEYFGGTSVYTDPETKDLRFELGTLQIGRLSHWRKNENDAYSLWDLMGLTFQEREINTAAGRQDKNLLVYSQGWFLVYFFYNFLVDHENVVQITEKPEGKYKEAFLNYFKGELGGVTGREALLKCLGMWKGSEVDQAKFDELEKEFTAYYNWLNRKVVTKYHVKDRRLIPWDQVENKGKMIGEKSDDMLYP